MMKYILMIQCILGLMILVVILLQKNSFNFLDGLGGSGSGKMQQSLEPNLLYNVMVGLCILFFICALILANLSNRYYEKSEQNFILQMEKDGVKKIADESNEDSSEVTIGNDSISDNNGSNNGKTNKIDNTNSQDDRNIDNVKDENNAQDVSDNIDSDDDVEADIDTDSDNNDEQDNKKNTHTNNINMNDNKGNINVKVKSTKGQGKSIRVKNKLPQKKKKKKI